MIKVILLDDEKSALDEMEYLLKGREEIEIVASYTEPLKAIAEFGQKNPDAVFLDIDMPLVNGLNAAKEFLGVNSNVNIVFATAYDEYAVNAFEINAIDYILKPLAKERLDKAVEKLVYINSLKSSGQKKVIIDKLNRIERCVRQNSERVAVYDDEEIILLKMPEIFYFEAECGKTSIITMRGKYKTKDTLDTLQKRLSEYGFLRCHRGYIVNLRYIGKISPMFNNYVIKLDDAQHQIPVSKKYIKDLKNMLGIS